MKTPATNPYLPLWEHVPDGEPHVFGDRVYIFGSHDEDGGDDFCLLDYVVWSAPVEDLGDWRCEGVIYRKDQDPLQQTGQIFTPPGHEGRLHSLFAPDVAQGRDGRYYLYYSLDFSNVISVAVCDEPAGHYEFLAHVARPDGTRPDNLQWFDPAILVEEGGNYLYVGSAPEVHYPGMPEEPIPGAMVMRLADDMHTILSEPVCVANGVETAKGTSFEAHPFFEASSIRHFGDWYYFVYSSLQGHELCYAMSRHPEGPFTYKGVLVSNGDVGLQGNTQPRCYLGNNHGGLVEIGGQYYIFWHRHTNGGQFSRQGCADRVELQPDGTFPQTEITSSGLNGGPLPAEATYPAAIACWLQGPDRAGMGMLPLAPCHDPESTIPYVTGYRDPGAPEGYLSYLCNLRPGALAAVKYLDFAPRTDYHISATLRGTGALEVRLDDPEGKVLATLNPQGQEWCTVRAFLGAVRGPHPVFFTVAGTETDCLEFADFRFA